MTTPSKPPIVLIHGLWMTPRSWHTWAARFRAAGHEVLTPGWPGIDDRDVADIRRDPSALKGIGVTEIVDHYARIIRGLAVPPIVMGHSFGGLFTQILADRGLGAAHVAVTPGQAAGVRVTPASTLWTGTPVLSNPFAVRGAKPMSKRHFHFTFGNDLDRAASDALWEEYAVNSYNRVLFQGVGGVFSGVGPTAVDFGKADRAPLLLIGGEIDHVVPPAIPRAMVEKYHAAGPAEVDYREFAGRTHRIVSQDGWEEVADAALEWATARTAG
jgi:non-heme chloroperoxidase